MEPVLRKGLAKRRLEELEDIVVADGYMAAGFKTSG
jgi:hypothetical protein